VQGVISARTLQQVAHLRRNDIKFVIVTGARTSTLLQRLPHLPAADAFVSENGGRIWYPDPAGVTGVWVSGELTCARLARLPWACKHAISA
jgi:hydroxymethylpyrimidine pyrophosphatase-like HAD family hydrolase